MENNEGHRLVTTKSFKLISLQESIMASSTYPLPTFHYCCASSHLSPWHRITWILLDRFSSVGRMKFFSVQAAMHFYALTALHLLFNTVNNTCISVTHLSDSFYSYNGSASKHRYMTKGKRRDF